MSRRTLPALAVAALGSALVLSTPLPALADLGFTPASTDVVGVGSDTTQFVLDYLADGHTVNGAAVPGYNAGRTTGRLASFEAIKDDGTKGDPIVLKAGSAPIARPNGSGAGKALLYGPTDNTDVSFARSSSSLSDAEVAGKLYQFPFAIDGIKLATAKTTNAPASISGSDLVKIYDGTYKNWKELGGKDAAIKPLIPQSGSGTRKVFTDQLKSLNGGTDVALASTVSETQEHSDADIKGNPDAVAPFSTGRAKFLTTIKLESGWSFTRALYNVVRDTDVAKPWADSLFGEAGFVCSAAAKPLIEAAGFEQLATPAKGGVCGEPTTTATTNFTVASDVVTPPAKVASRTVLVPTAAASYGRIRTVVATVRTGSAAATGAVSIKVGSRAAVSVRLVGGRAALALPVGLAVGTYPVTVSYAGTATVGASRTVGVVRVTKARSTVSFTAPKKIKAKKRAKVAVRVALPGLPAAFQASGTVVVYDGKKVVGAKVLSTSGKGKVTITLKKLKKGKHRLSVRYAGSSNLAASTSSVRKLRVR